MQEAMLNYDRDRLKYPRKRLGTGNVKEGLILHTPGPEIRQHVAYIYIDTPCAYPPSYPSIRYA